MKVLAIGDVVGKSGRRALVQGLNLLKKQNSYDFILVNGENIAGGFGITKKIFDYLIDDLKVDCVTMGNHWHDKPEIHRFFGETSRLVLPANMSNVSEENYGCKILRTAQGTEIAVINLLGRAFMGPDQRNPLEAAQRLLDRLPSYIKVRIIDMHAEATSEKQALAHLLDGQVSLVYGTHSHVQTSDERILKKETGFITDVGMTGAYDSVVGINKESAIRRLLTGVKKNFEPAEDDLWFCAVVADIDPSTGSCKSIERVCLRELSSVSS